MRNGDVFFGNDKILPDALTGKVKDRLANRVDKRVYIRADARAKFGRVVEVVDNIRAAGVDQLGLLTDQRKDKGRHYPTDHGATRRRSIEEISYGNGSWPERRPKRKY